MTESKKTGLDKLVGQSCWFKHIEAGDKIYGEILEFVRPKDGPRSGTLTVVVLTTKGEILEVNCVQLKVQVAEVDFKDIDF